jgi:putative serine protease PepD
MKTVNDERTTPPMTRRPRTPLMASLLAAACLGAGGGAALYATFANGGGGKTIVRQVTVDNSQPTASTTPLSVNAIYRRAYRGVVEITVTSTQAGQFPFGGSQTQRAQGSGFVYNANGDIGTNQHVVNGAQTVSVKFWNGKTYKATVVGTDSSTDLAVVHVNAPSSELYPLSLGSSNSLEVGDGVVAIGSPFGLAETVTSGIVSALHRDMTSPSNFQIKNSIQTDAAINHGNSGGPLLNTAGRVIGVNAQIESDSGGNDGVGFAIPSDTVHSIVTQLISTGKALHAFLGVELDNTSTGGARIASVPSSTPAAKAKLHAGDVVTAVGSTKVGSSDALQSAIDSKRPGDTITLTFKRSGSSHTVRVKLASRPS